MYDVVVDTYCYEDVPVLKNIPGIKSQKDLDAFEYAVTLSRAEEPLPKGILDTKQYRDIHHHLFQDVYEWAGEYRTVRISKDGSMFCYPERISDEMEKLFNEMVTEEKLGNLSKDKFIVQGAHFLSELNAIHPFREGNGRTQLSFFLLLSESCGHPINLDNLDTDTFLEAMITSFNGKELPLQSQIRTVMA